MMLRLVLIVFIAVANAKRLLLEVELSSLVGRLDMGDEASDQSRQRLSRMLLAFKSLSRLKFDYELKDEPAWRHSLLDYDPVGVTDDLIDFTEDVFQ